MKLITKLQKSKFLFFLISIFFIIIVGISIGIYFIVMKTKKSTKNSNDGNIKMNNKVYSFSGFTPIKGYWLWTWNGEGGNNPSEINDIGIRFGGESPKTAIDNNINFASSLTAREKFLNIG